MVSRALTTLDAMTAAALALTATGPPPTPVAGALSSVLPRVGGVPAAGSGRPAAVAERPLSKIRGELHCGTSPGALATRFTGGSFQRLSCVAEELAVRLLLTEAHVTLETFGLLHEGVSAALEAFADNVYEDMDHEWLYDDSMDGIDEGPVGHPYAADEPEAATP